MKKERMKIKRNIVNVIIFIVATTFVAIVTTGFFREKNTMIIRNHGNYDLSVVLSETNQVKSGAEVINVPPNEQIEIIYKYGGNKKTLFIVEETRVIYRFALPDEWKRGVIYFTFVLYK